MCLPVPGAYGPVAEEIDRWAHVLRSQRLVPQITLATYEPQPGRYGHAAALRAAHEVFAADSTAALAQIRMADLASVPPQALAAASLVDLATRFADTAELGLRWLIEHLPRAYGRLDPAVRDQALDLADPYGHGTRLRSLPGGAEAADAWQARATALAAYREHLTSQRDPLTVLRSLLHQHHRRALGADPDRERTTGRLARTCALRHTERTQRPM